MIGCIVGCAVALLVWVWLRRRNKQQRLDRTAPSPRASEQSRAAHRLDSASQRQRPHQPSFHVEQHPPSAAHVRNAPRPSATREERCNASAPRSTGLPPGWHSAVDDRSGHAYFWHDSGVVQWERPQPNVRQPPLPPIRSRLDRKNVEAALAEREAMREAEEVERATILSRQVHQVRSGRVPSENAHRAAALQEQHDLEMAIALSRSLDDSSCPRSHGNYHSSADLYRPGDAATAAGAAAARRAAASCSSPSTTSQLPHRRQQLTPISPAARVGPSSPGGPLPPVCTRDNHEHTAEFIAAVEERFNEWSTTMYASNTYLHEIGSTAREEQRDRIRAALEREWLAAGMPVYVVGHERRRFGPGIAGVGRRLGSGD